LLQVWVVDSRRFADGAGESNMIRACSGDVLKTALSFNFKRLRSIGYVNLTRLVDFKERSDIVSAPGAMASQSPD